jgi:hypothetical protein
MAIIRDDERRDQQIAATRRLINERAADIRKRIDLLALQIPPRYRLKLYDLGLDVSELAGYMRAALEAAA